MKLKVTQTDDRNIALSLPRWLYMNGLAVSIITMRRDVPISPRQARKCLRAVKKTMRAKGIRSIAEVEVNAGDTQVHINL